MASDRQIEANRRNAAKSTGPRTRAGLRRSRNNAYRHGLAAVFNGKALVEIEKLALQIGGDSLDPVTLQHARNAAHAEFRLARITRLKLSWIQRVCETGHVEMPPGAVFRQRLLDLLRKGVPLPPPDCATMPPPGPERVTEAIRRALPVLSQLERYERRAAATRNRALRALVRSRRRAQIQPNEANFV